jgi:Trypsin-like peptidase domain
MSDLPRITKRLCLPASLLAALLISCASFATVFDTSPRRLATPGEGIIFRAVNKIACRIGNGAHIETTAALVVSDQIVVTVAHAFYNKDTKDEELNPDDCVYVVYDKDNDIIDRVKIAAINSRWVEDDRYYDDTQDIALVTLDRPPEGHIKPLQLKLRPSEPGTPITLIAFHIGIDGGGSRVFSAGEIVSKLGSDQEHNDTILIHNASAVKETSGAPLIDTKTGLVLGLNTGEDYQPSKAHSREFDARHNYNRGIIFDDQFERDLQAALQVVSTQVKREPLTVSPTTVIVVTLLLLTLILGGFQGRLRTK